MQLTVVTPTYNEAENLPKLVSALFDLPIPELKILVADDNSPDGTGQIADDLAAKCPQRLSVLHRPLKQGLGPACLHGFRVALEAGADAVAQMDADFSHPPEKLMGMMQAIHTSDVVVGSRYTPGGQVDETWPLWRKGLSAFGNFYARTILQLPIQDATGGFRIYRRKTLLEMPLERVRSNGYVFQVEMIYLAHLYGFSVHEIPIYFADRKRGESKMSLRIQLEAALRVWQVLLDYRDLQRLANLLNQPNG